nr:hypothetical protein [Tanacetum cinerariifolium]
MEWHDYKHLDWISVRRDDDQIYKFKEGNFKRLRLQDIEDMLLLLVQGKLSNLTVEERLAFNVSLRMFTRSIVIQRRVEDLQLGVESYQKKLNLTRPDTYRSDLKRREAYTAYSNPRGFIYQNKDKKNRLMRIDELHKFSDGTLNDRKGDKDRAVAMIQAIEKMLKTRRIMRSLEKFVGGRLAAMRRNSLFSSSFNIFDSLSKIHKDHHWEIQRQSWNEDSRLDDLIRDEANGALSDVCGCVKDRSLVPTVDKADKLILQDTLQVSLAEHKSRQEQEARENVALVEEHLASVEIEKIVEGQENVVDDSSIPRNAEHNIPDTRLEPKSDKESPKVEFTDVVIPVNVYNEEEEEDEITDEVYELKRREKGKNVEESRITSFPTPIRSPRIHTDLVSLDNEKLQELTVTTSSSSSPNTKLSNRSQLLSLFKAKPAHFKFYKSFFQEL